MAHRYPLPYAFARSHQLLLEDDGTRLTLWLCPESGPNAISEVMRKWGHAELSLDIAREDTSDLRQRVSKAYTAQYGPGMLYKLFEPSVAPKHPAGRSSTRKAQSPCLSVGSRH